jgi:hypothetical protein
LSQLLFLLANELNLNFTSHFLISLYQLPVLKKTFFSAKLSHGSLYSHF